jgi:isopentenyl-diphosphate delta-isomerase
MNEPYVILVDEHDNKTGTIEKLEAHKKALLHRAVSVFIINSKGEWILQRRALNKYHSNGLWTNTCCSHPYPEETSLEAATRRLMEEMGLQCDLHEIFSFIYKEQFDNDLTEHEFDHIFIGISDDRPMLNQHEAMDWRTISFTDLEHEMNKNPAHFTAWFRHIYRRVNACIIKRKDE